LPKKVKSPAKSPMTGGKMKVKNVGMNPKKMRFM
jgi:hypothetical protein